MCYNCALLINAPLLRKIPVNEKDSIRFSVDIEQSQDEDGQPLPVALVKVFVNNVEPLPSVMGRPLDALHLLVRGAEPGDFFAYTCSCGVEGCAGFFDPCKLGITADTVTWEIVPPETAASQTEAEAAQAKATKYCFDRAKYLLALDLLEEQLQELEAENPKLQYAPFDGRAGDSASTVLDETLVRMRAYFRSQQAKDRAFALAFGDITNSHWAVQWRDAKFNLYPQGLCNAACGSEQPQSLLEQFEHWSAVAQSARADLRSLLTQLEWTEIQPYLFYDRRNGGLSDEALDNMELLCPPGFWTDATIEMVKEN